jgi:multiple antibiotic resistance protein
MKRAILSMKKRIGTSLILMAVFLIVTACINVINLATAEAIKRSKEVGIRKTLGSARSQLIFQFLGITLPAFQIAASIILMLVALDMLRAQRSRVQETSEETTAGAAKTDIAIAPLAIPMLAGPGAISTAILLHNQARNLAEQIALCLCILAVAFVSYLILRISARGAKWLSPIALNITVRIMGLLLAAIAIQFMLKAIKELRTEWLAPM